MADTQAFEAWWDGRALPGNLKAAFFMVWQAALASRPAEVDDEGLPKLPPESARASKGEGQFYMKWSETGKDLRGELLLFTAEQYRQGQRDAVAADRARSNSEGQSDAKRLVFVMQDIDGFVNVTQDKYDLTVLAMEERSINEPNWECELEGIRRLIDKAMSTPSHTTNKEN